MLISLNPNEVQLIVAVIGASSTILAACIAVAIAFKQISRQFEHKVVYEGWQDLQEKLFNFSTALSNYDTTILGLAYFISSQDNPLVNGNNKNEYRRKKWEELSNLYSELLKTYVELLRSFENHEVIFLSLRKMKSNFVKEFRTRTENDTFDFIAKIFPEMFGTQVVTPDDELRKLIHSHWRELTEISAFLDDFRVELQNETAGKILNKKVPRRTPPGNYKVLTKKGFIGKKGSIKARLKKIYKKIGSYISSIVRK